jgi:replicative DNA helicase
MRELIVKSEGLVTTKRDVAQPQRLEFHNGSYILGITAGTRTGMQGNKARGQDATDMYLDEADYLDQKSLESLLAIFASDANCALWASSTPTGKRAWFWEICTKKETSGFKEFHYKSSVSPAWNIEMEQSYRDMYPIAVYAHEFDAEFGDQETGVYQKQFIDTSIRDYYYTDKKCQRNWKHGYLYALGVDWNAHKNGVHMIVVEYDPTTNEIKVVLHESVEAQEFTQTKAIEHIINLHAKWMFDCVYVDSGFGDVQIEQLHLYGHKHPQSRLAKIVRGIRMQENIVIRDPATKKEVKKNSKHLMVNITARRVECEQCVFPRSEDVRHGLVWQIRNLPRPCSMAAGCIRLDYGVHRHSQSQAFEQGRVCRRAWYETYTSRSGDTRRQAREG